jgi:hypothetical protein
VNPANDERVFKHHSTYVERFTLVREAAAKGTRRDVAVATRLPVARRADKYLKRLFFNLEAIESDESNKLTFDDAT